MRRLLQVYDLKAKISPCYFALFDPGLEAQHHFKGIGVTVPAMVTVRMSGLPFLTLKVASISLGLAGQSDNSNQTATA